MEKFQGGFGGAGLVHASESLRARCAAEEAEYQRETARLERQRQQEAEARRERDIAASAWAAEDRGEFLTAKERLEGVGRTKAEAISYYSALADIEDMRAAHAARKEYEKFQQFLAEENSGDLTAEQPGDTMRAKIARWKIRNGLASPAESQKFYAENAHAVEMGLYSKIYERHA